MKYACPFVPFQPSVLFSLLWHTLLISKINRNVHEKSIWKKVYTHARTHSHTHTHTHACTHALTCTHKQTHTHTHAHALTCTHTNTHTHTCTSMRAHTHAHAQACARAHTHTNTHTAAAVRWCTEKNSMLLSDCMCLCGYNVFAGLHCKRHWIGQPHGGTDTNCTQHSSWRWVSWCVQ